MNIQRVLMTADTVGGVWTYALDLARAYATHEIKTSLATMGARLSDHQWREAAAIPGLRVFESGYRLEWMESPWKDVDRAGDWLLTLENEIQPDILHLNGYAHGHLPWRAPHLIVAHSCVLSWWRAVKGEPAPPAWNDYRLRVGRGLRAADCVIAPSHAMLASISEDYGPLRDSRVIPNGRDPQPSSHGRKQPFIFAAGRVWDEAKNLNQLSRIAGRLAWPVHIAGDAQHPSGRTVDLPGVQLEGKLPPDQLAARLSQAAIYCLPARYEPFGLSVLEAAHSGCALVLGDIPSLRENWEGAATFVTPGDDEALECALRTLIADPVARELAGRSAHARAEKFLLSRTAEAYLEIYSQLTSSKVLANE